MARVVNVDMEMRVAKVETAFNRFFKKYPELEYWRETFEYMANNNEDFFSDYYFDTANRVRNENWGYALHLNVDDKFVYMAVIERA